MPNEKLPKRRAQRRIIHTDLRTGHEKIYRSAKEASIALAIDNSTISKYSKKHLVHNNINKFEYA